MKKINTLFFICFTFFSISASAQYITEIEYDVPGADVAGSEYVEVFYPTGTNPADYSLIGINGSTPASGLVYVTVATSSCNATVPPAPAGQLCVYTGGADAIQNGANDAIILYNTITMVVVQALAYEGTVTVSVGAVPAAIAGLVISTNIGTDPGTTAGVSLRDDDGDGVFVLGATNQGALPIELLSLTANVKGNCALLSFSTATETNNAYFSIERSQDGNRFETIGKVTGAGTTTEKQNYTFTDERPLKGTNFYRLKQVDFDGQFSYSPVVSVNIGKVGGVRLSPQPVLDRLNVALEQPAVEAAIWQVYDFAGRLLQSGTVQEESTNFEISTTTLTEGTYVLRLVSGQQIVTQQFQKN